MAQKEIETLHQGDTFQRGRKRKILSIVNKRCNTVAMVILPHEGGGRKKKGGG